MLRRFNVDNQLVPLTIIRMEHALHQPAQHIHLCKFGQTSPLVVYLAMGQLSQFVKVVALLTIFIMTVPQIYVLAQHVPINMASSAVSAILLSAYLVPIRQNYQTIINLVLMQHARFPTVKPAKMVFAQNVTKITLFTKRPVLAS